MTALLSAEGLTKQYPTGDGGVLDVLTGVDLSIEEGAFVAIVGESGTGKSTLLHLLGGLDRPTAGRVLFRGENLFEKSDEALAQFRNRHLGFVFQFHHLLPEFTALENVAMPALLQNRSLRSVEGRARALLEMLGLGPRLAHRPTQLSGGEQQRVAVARALMNAPDLVLMDEPTGNLDTATAHALHEEIARLHREEGRTFVVVTHNPALAALADRVMRVEGGHTRAEVAPSEALR